jgi:hypothetical protein
MNNALKIVLPPRRTPLSSNGNNDYHAINLLLWLFVVLCFVVLRYTDVHIQCIYKQAGLSCASCGLTTSLRHALRGEFSGIPTAFIVLFLMFALQLLLRPAVSYALHFKKNKVVAVADSVFHFILAIVFVYLLYIK